MKRILILAILTAGLLGNVYSQTRAAQKNPAKISPAEEQTLIGNEKQTWMFLKQRDFKGFGSLVAEDFYGIFPSMENVTKPKLLELVAGFEIKDFQFSDVKVTMLDKTAAIITYQVDERVTYNGQTFLNHNTITSGWAKRGGKWLNVFFRPFVLISNKA